MEWLERMRESIDYIEDNLYNEIDFAEVARKAYCSAFHFHRMFSILTGVSAAEYVRRRRLTLAAQELMCSNTKIIDIALKFGYESPDAFTRAFQKVHGVSPSTARESGVQLVAYPRITFQIILKGGYDMDYRIVEKESFKVVGRSRKFSDVNDGTENIPKFWGECNRSGFCERLVNNLCKGRPGKVTEGHTLGVCINICSGEKDEFAYLIGVEMPEGDIPDYLDTVTMPASTWAVFNCVGPMPFAIQDLWKKIYEEWFPSTGYEQNYKVPDFEVYFPGDMSSKDYRFQIWIPIVRDGK